MSTIMEDLPKKKEEVIPGDGEEKDVKVESTPDNNGNADGATLTTNNGEQKATNQVAGGNADDTRTTLMDTEKAIDEAHETGRKRWLSFLEGKRPETDDEKKKREKREKRERIFAAIGDGISAISNLYFATKGAPNMFNKDNMLSTAVKARHDKLKAEREANEKWYQDANAHLDDLEYKYATGKHKRLLDEQKDKRESKIHEQNVLLNDNKITKSQYDAETAKHNVDKAQADAEYARYKVDNAPQEAQDKHNESETRQTANVARAGASNAAAGASKARANESNARAKNIQLYGNGGKPTDNSPVVEATTSTVTDQRGRTKTTETTKTREKVKPNAKGKSPTGDNGKKKSPTK